jgi:hypothetical protein
MIDPIVAVKPQVGGMTAGTAVGSSFPDGNNPSIASRMFAGKPFSSFGSGRSGFNTRSAYRITESARSIT